MAGGLLVVGLILALALPPLLDGFRAMGALTGRDPVVGEDPDDGSDGDEDDDPRADDPAEPAPPDEDLLVPDVADLDGVDAVYGSLLVDIDASERAMIAFQDGLRVAFEEHGLGDTEGLFDRIEAAAQEGVGRLTEVRRNLADPLDEDGAEAIRAVYVDHLDAWVRYMEAVDEDPALLDPQVDSTRYTLAINTSAEAFARTLEEELPDDVADEVATFADGILDRGFRRDGPPQV